MKMITAAALATLTLTTTAGGLASWTLFQNALRDQTAIQATLDDCTTKWDVKRCKFYALPANAPMAEKPELPEVLKQYVSASGAVLTPIRTSQNPSMKGQALLDEPAYN